MFRLEFAYELTDLDGQGNLHESLTNACNGRMMLFQSKRGHDMILLR